MNQILLPELPIKGASMEKVWVDPLEKMIEQHANISEFVENHEKIVRFLFAKPDKHQLALINRFIDQDILLHFEFEETEIFPVILSKLHGLEYTELILELEKEHGAMLSSIAMLRRLISENPNLIDKEGNRRIGLLLREIADAILEHAAKEDDNLLPVIASNRSLFEGSIGASLRPAELSQNGRH